MSPRLSADLIADLVDAGSREHYSDAALYDYEYRRRRADLSFYKELAKRRLGGSGRILELGAGSGRITIPLARAGYEVVAVDSSKPMLEKLRARVDALPSSVARRITIVDADLRSFLIPDADATGTAASRRKSAHGDSGRMSSSAGTRSAPDTARRASSSRAKSDTARGASSTRAKSDIARGASSTRASSDAALGSSTRAKSDASGASSTHTGSSSTREKSGASGASSTRARAGGASLTHTKSDTGSSSTRETSARSASSSHEVASSSSGRSAPDAASITRAQFPLAIAVFNVLEHLYTRVELDACLRCVRDHLAPGGAFAFDVQVPDLAWLLRDPQKRWARTRFTDPTTGRQMFYSTNHDYDPVGQIALIRLYYEPVDGKGPVRIVKLSQRKYFPAELEALVAHAGLRVVERYGDFLGRPLDGTAESQVLVCEAANPQISRREKAVSRRGFRSR